MTIYHLTDLLMKYLYINENLGYITMYLLQKDCT